MTVKPQTKDLKKIRLGTRGSPLALVQAHMVRDELAKIDPDIQVEIKVIKTSGDWSPEQGEIRLEEVQGGKALFAKELEAALQQGEIDAAVHSMKDMETILPEGLCIPFMLPREDVRDIFLSNISQNINELPMGSIVGTVSARRAAFVLSKRPDLKIVPLRGNVQTRIDKLRAGQVDATLLAYAGLSRLNLITQATSFISVEDILPAAGQGAIGIEIREKDVDKLSIFGQISCDKTVICVSTERAVLEGMLGSCHTPAGVYTMFSDGELHVRAVLMAPDGSRFAHREVRQNISTLAEAQAIGQKIGEALRADAPPGSLDG